MNQVSENHESALKSEGISENMYLEFFGFTFFVSAFIAYSASHFCDYLQTEGKEAYRSRASQSINFLMLTAGTFRKASKHHQRNCESWQLILIQ